MKKGLCDGNLLLSTFYFLLPSVMHFSLGLEHLEAGGGGFNALVAVFAARAVGGLLRSVAGQHAEDDRHRVFDTYLRNPVGHGLGDELEMARFPLDDAAEADDRIYILVGIQQHRGS